MEDPDLWKMMGKLISLGLVVLLGALVAYAAQKERRRSNHSGLSKDKPSFLRELRDRLKDPFKPTDY